MRCAIGGGTNGRRRAKAARSSSVYSPLLLARPVVPMYDNRSFSWDVCDGGSKGGCVCGPLGPSFFVFSPDASE